MTDIDLERLAVLLAKATLPWLEGDELSADIIGSDNLAVAYDGGITSDDTAVLIVAAVNSLPSLIKRIRELEQSLTEADRKNDATLLEWNAAEDRVKVLEETLRQILDAPMIDHSRPERGVYGIARTALKDTNNQEGRA